ncbi:hypothetical protein [Microbispora sp. KK1-11]|uniref:hypothetical protein n=1 Tax=Microbispora sp. KK1-11 TaxID=2053005 RepID=UPI0011595AE6|nr:hypothetical protein [Microbispora sp. KK1-11]TQS27016.1 hypothetical protein FLW16_21925 [Microbispora sp. KK1-11]
MHTAQPTATEVAKTLVGWIRDQTWSGVNNYTVAVYRDNDLIISRVKGIPGLESQGAQEIVRYIQAQRMNLGRAIYFATAFTSGDGAASNHAEMCILAAVGAGNLSDITFMLCSAANCKYCKMLLAKFKINNGNATGPDGKSQQGWYHPFVPLRFGTQMGTEADQLKELQKFLNGEITLKDTKTGQVAQSPKLRPAGEMWRVSATQFALYPPNTDDAMSQDDSDD